MDHEKLSIKISNYHDITIRLCAKERKKGRGGVKIEWSTPTLDIPPYHGMKALLDIPLASVRHHTRGSPSSLCCLMKVLQFKASSHISVKFDVRMK